MEVLAAVLCDSAADYNGKLCILGTFDTISVPEFPAKHPHCAIALRLLFRDSDRGEHTFQITFIDSDARNLLPNGGPKLGFSVHDIPEETCFLSRNLVFNLQGLPLRAAAQHSFDILMDSKIVARIPLHVVQGPPPGTLPRPPHE